MSPLVFLSFGLVDHVACDGPAGGWVHERVVGFCWFITTLADRDDPQALSGEIRGLAVLRADTAAHGEERWTFLAQILGTDHSCRKAVTRLIAYLRVRGQRACEPDTGAYCKARQGLPLGVIRRLVHQTSGLIERHALIGWRWNGREVVLIDGTTVSMPDTVENQSRFPQQSMQKLGLGFPIAWLVAVISLSTGVLRDIAIGPYKGLRERRGCNPLSTTLEHRIRFKIHQD